MVSIYDDPHATGALRFTFVPKRIRQTRVEVEPPQAVPQSIVSIQDYGDETQFHWIKPPTEQTTREELERIARQRVTARPEWLEKLRKLVATVKGWADELDWATRTVDKKMEDAEIGNYKAPALLLQQETVRLFLEPVARAAPGTEGVVDLYLMPSYDDIASLYYYNNRWNVHYMFDRAPTLGNVREAEAKPLTKATLHIRKPKGAEAFVNRARDRGHIAQADTDAVHRVREYRNVLVHERSRPVTPVTIREVTSFLCTFLSRVQRIW